MIIRYIRAWIHKHILYIKSPSAYIAGWEYEWDLITKGARMNAVEEVNADEDSD